ncbi:MAG: glycoside hydrolase family 127 protein, partial [Candidatus Hydrogenedentota bacterium]
ICTIQRTWENGDEVKLSFPMKLRLVKGRRSQVGRVAVMHGPLIFGLSKQHNEGLEDIQPRLLTINVDTLEGPIPDNSVHPGGLACTIEAWDPGQWYPGPTSRKLTLTEFPDPGVQAGYFVAPNPENNRFVHDELFATEK